MTGEVLELASILHLEAVVKRFPGFLLDRVSFDIGPGSVMALLGPNGAGKTTTIKLILGLLHLDGGRISVLGMDSRRQEQLVKQNIGYLGEHALLPPEATARWLGQFLSVTFAAWDDRLYRSYLERFDVPVGKPVRALSKGTRTKLALAAALGHRPRLLVLDEPTTGLDPLVRQEVVAAIREVAADGRRAVLFSTHIVSDAEAAADWVTVLARGRVVTSEPKARLLSHYPNLEEAFRALLTEGRDPAGDRKGGR